MAIYHLSVKTLSRSAGRSATAAAAYRAAVYIADERTGEIHDYSRKGGVESADLVLPGNAPAWASDRAVLWNAAEQAETRKNSTVAREFEIALPADLSEAERRRLAADFAREIVERHGCAADVCVHAPGREGDNRNHHAHILLTTRRLGAEGFTEKTRELDDRKTGEVERWRQRFAEIQNERLEQAGSQARVDHRSLEAQGLDREPTRHLGPAVSGLVRRGAPSDVARRMAEEADARLFAARETGRIERELAEAEHSILDLSGDLAGAIRKREERQREAERPPKGAERTGPAVHSSRFKAKPEPPPAKQPRPGSIAAIAAALGKIDRGAPIEQQAQAFDKIQNALAETRKARLDRAAQKATARRDRRAKAARKVWQASPRPPTGLLASFKRQGYETALGQWQKDRMRADRLNDQAEKTRGKIVYQALHSSGQQDWAKRRMERIAPDLTRRMDTHKAAERAKQEEQRRQEQARTTLERKFKGMASRRAMKAHGYTDSSKQWQATPKLLREIIDDYNSRPKEQQERGLAAWMRDPEKSEAIATMIEQHRQHSQDQGMSR